MREVKERKMSHINGKKEGRERKGEEGKSGGIVYYQVTEYISFFVPLPEALDTYHSSCKMEVFFLI